MKKQNNIQSNCLVTVSDEDYAIIKQFRVNSKHVNFVNNSYYLYILLILLFVVCIIMGADNLSLSKNNEKLNMSNKALYVENTVLIDKCRQLEYALWDKKLHNLIGVYTIKPNSEINKDTLYTFLNNHSDVFLFPDVVYAQVVLESGAGTSNLYKISNNLIGMMFPTERETTAIGKTESGFAKYKNWQSCVLDRPLWDKHVFGGSFPSKEEYLGTIGRIYAEDPNYLTNIQQIIDTDYNNRILK